MILLLLLAAAAYLSGLWLFLYTAHIEPNRYVIEPQQLTSPRIQKSADGLKIVQISDIHLSDDDAPTKLARLGKLVNRAKPDILVFTGDLFDDYSAYHGDLSAVSAALNAMNASVIKLAVWGNHDRSIACMEVFESTLQAGGFRVLRAETVQLKRCGISISGYADGIYDQFPADFQPDAGNDFHLVLCHEPDLSKLIDPNAYDLMLSGHTHGGQVRLPILGLLYAPHLGERYLSGWYAPGGENARARLYVNRGIGGAMLPLRFRSQPEVTAITLFSTRQ